MLDLGAFTSGLVTGLREGVEAALIVSIILAYLARTGNRRLFGRIALGAGSAALLSVVIGALLFATVRELKAPYEQLLEGITMLVAATVVTWMLFWMRRQAASVKGDLVHALDRALAIGSVGALVLLAFTAVIREGIETSLFLVGQATAATAAGGSAGASSLLVGALAGLAVAAALGVGFYHGTRRINLQVFFRWTGIALVFIAGGLISRAVHELIEIRVVTVGTATAFDISRVLPDAGATVAGMTGGFLRVLVGYSAAPEWATLVVWIGYVGAVLALYLRPVTPRARPTAPSEVAPPAQA